MSAPETKDAKHVRHEYADLLFTAQVDEYGTGVALRRSGGEYLGMSADGLVALREFIAAVDAAEAAMRPKADAG